MKKDYKNQNDRKVVLKEQGAITQVEMKSITVIICDGYLSTLHFLSEQKKITVSKLLKDFEAELTPYGFFRVNRNTLVNMNNIYSLQSGDKRIITLVNNQKILVSSRRISNFRKVFHNESTSVV